MLQPHAPVLMILILIGLFLCVLVSADGRREYDDVVGRLGPMAHGQYGNNLTVSVVMV